MASESQILQGLDQEDPESDPATDAATDATERSEGRIPKDSDTTELDDGGAIIRLQDEKSVEEAEEFYENLALKLPQQELKEIGVKLMDLFEKDVTARTKRDQQYEEGLKRTGFANDAPGGATFDGASKVTHPLIAEVAIDFSARAIKELWPAGGPVKDKVIGEPDDKKLEKAKRKVRWMNWQMTEGMPNMRYELEQILTQVPMGGVQYSKFWWDRKKKGPQHEPVWVDEMVIPFAATSFYGAPRKAHVQKLDQFTFDYRVRTGWYRDVDAIRMVTSPDQTKAERANDKIEGKSETSFNEDGVRTVLEFDVQYVVSDDKRKVDLSDDNDDAE
jgi:hypothetical protein